ncbi:hypothetical protein D3C81_2031260 [compost metagenome]
MLADPADGNVGFLIMAADIVLGLINELLVAGLPFHGNRVHQPAAYPNNPLFSFTHIVELMNL